MSTNVPDRRVIKTRQHLQDALIELVIEKNYQQITVQEILDRANVGRSTFYAHFQDKDQLLYSCFDSFHELLDQHSRRLSELGKNFANSNRVDLPFGLFEFARKNHRFLKAMLGKHGNGMFNKAVYDHILTQSHEHIRLLMPQGKQGSIRSEIAAHYLVSAFIGTLTWWIEKDMPCPPQEIGEFLKQMAVPNFKKALEMSQKTKI